MAEMNVNSDVSKVKKLGRGLSALLQVPVKVDVPRVEGGGGGEINRVAAAVPQVVGESGGGVREVVAVPAVARTEDGGKGVELVAVSEIVPSRFQARKSFDEAGLHGLVESLRTTGVMQPVIVRPVSAGKYELVAGERRWRAAKIVGLEKLPAIVRVLTDQESAEWGLAENLQREDLNPMDRAAGIRMMSEQFDMTHDQIAKRLGIQRSTITNTARLLDLEADIAELVAGGALTMAHGKALLAMSAGAERVDLAREAVRREWNVRQLTTAVGAAERSRNGGGEALNVDAIAASEEVNAEKSGTRAIVLDLERRLSQQLGTKVEIAMSGSGKKGKIVIEFYGLDHFDGLVGKMGVR